MKRVKTVLVLLSLLGSLSILGCHTAPPPTVVVTPSGEILAPAKPPAPRHEVAGVRPNDSFVWIGGYWTYQNSQWIWVPGHWEAPVRTGSAWVPGHWDPSTRGWVWTPGHWE